MSEAVFIPLEDRALLRVAGDEAADFLQGLITCDVEHLEPGDITFGALLSPQGKILFDFFIIAATNSFLVDVDASLADDLLKRLVFYRLRRKIDIDRMDERTHVFAITGSNEAISSVVADGIVTMDPRHTGMGARAYLRRQPEDCAAGSLEDWHESRIRLGMPEGGKDFSYGDAFPHEALMDQFKGVDFAKGCYVGQEVVSRMQHRGTARKRLVKVASEKPLPESGTEILAGGKTCGTLCSVSANNGLAMVRLDKVAANAPDHSVLAGSLPAALSIAEWCDFDWPEQA